MSDLQTVFSNAITNIKSKISGGKAYEIINVKSNVDGRTYTVRDMPDKQEAADLMARVRAKIEKLYKAMKDKFPHKAQVKQWMRNFEPNPERFMESTPEAEHTSFSVNKGEKIHLCLRQREDLGKESENETLVDENVMVFVALHEMAHVITPTVGHDPTFWNNFAWLLKQAEELEIYKYQDFKAHPVAYCGLKITDAPAYDPKKDGTDLSLG